MLDRISRQDEPERPGPRRTEEREPAERRPEPSPGRGRLTPRGRRRLLWVAGVIAVLLLIAALVSRHFDEYLRRTLETKINQRLHGYTVRLAHAHLSPLNLSLTLEGATIRQQAHPEPPVAAIPRLTASVQWRELLQLHLVTNATFDRPRVHLNLPQLRAEDRDRVDVEDRGWQDALQSIYPLKFNLIEVRDGDIVYVDDDPERPLHVSDWHFRAEDIRNVRSTDKVYPSPIHTEGTIFESGRAVVDGHADFLAKPVPGFHAVYEVEKVPLSRLRPIGDRANLRLRGGVLDSRGEFEFGPKHREVRVDDVTVSGLRLDYVHTSATAAAEKERGEEVAEVAKDPTPETRMRIVRLRLADSELGLVDRSREQGYRLFVDGADLDVENLSAGFVQGPAKGRLSGRFMGSGSTRASGTFRADPKGPDFDLDVAIEGASLPAINDFLRTYGKLDVVKGTFSVYSEIHVRNGAITGYVKPLFKDIDVYDSKQDKKKPVIKKIYEKIVGGLSHLLENEPRDQVATVVDISGSIADPETSTWDTVVRLVSNAFVKAILPGFERELENVRKNKDR
jgi:hypothetical protein